MRVPFSYLDRQFADPDPYLQDIREIVQQGHFTLGDPVAEFEQKFAKLTGTKHAIGVASGFDSLFLSLKLMGIGKGDEVVTVANTFIATIGAIAMTGATPVLVDCDSQYVIDVSKIEAAITSKTKAIMPVHYTGNMANMPEIMKLAERHGLQVIEDACQAIGAAYNDRPAGSWGLAAGFSLHPLKNLHVWGDGGIITTNSDEFAEQLRLFRNHGLINRDEVVMFGHNSRLDTLHAVIGNRSIEQVTETNNRRIEIAQQYDAAFKDLQPDVEVPPRPEEVRNVFHLYILRTQRRDELVSYLVEKGIEAKVHYPIPVHLQPAAHSLPYQNGDFPQTESDCANIVTLPSHQYLTSEEVEYTVEQVHQFYQTN